MKPLVLAILLLLVGYSLVEQLSAKSITKLRSKKHFKRGIETLKEREKSNKKYQRYFPSSKTSGMNMSCLVYRGIFQ